jgi:TM2 domain-containing membrane protein YozV
MPLTTCPDCGGSVSDAAPACIHCGRPSGGGTAEREPIPAALPLRTPPKCGRCGNRLAGDALYDAGPLDCPWCGAEYTVLEVPAYRAATGRREARGSAGNVVAAIASFFIPGLGQLVQGRGGRGVAFFVGAALLWLLVFGWIVHIWAAIDAATWDRA